MSVMLTVFLPICPTIYLPDAAKTPGGWDARTKQSTFRPRRAMTLPAGSTWIHGW
jgi:hypothetical protein